MTTAAAEHTPDHATTRIITELAAELLPHLKETVTSELARTLESLPVNIDREVEQALSSLKRLQAVFEDMTVALNSAQRAAQRVSNDLLPLSRMCETLRAAIERLEELTAKPDVKETPLDELVRSFEAIISDWGGILKASGRAHTKELNEFSAEVTELVGDMKSSLPAMLGEILGKALLSHTEELTKASGESVRTLETRLTRLEKIILTGGAVFFACLAAIAAALFLR